MQFRVLGSVEVFTDDGRVLTLPRRHERCVLAILLIEAGRPVSSHHLIDLLWEGNPPGQPLQGLRIYIARIRSVLAQAGGPVFEALFEGGGDRVHRHHFTRSYMLTFAPKSFFSPMK